MIDQLNKSQTSKHEIKMFNPNKLSYLNKFTLEQLNLLMNESKRCYEEYDLAGLFENINTFFVNKIHDVYLKSIKVPLNPNDLGTLHVFQRICELSCIAIAPVFPHLSEIVFRYMKSDFNQTSEIFHMKWPNIVQSRKTEKLEKIDNKFQTLLELRTKIQIEISKLEIKYGGLLKQKGKYQYVFIIEDPFSEEMELLDGVGAELSSFLGLDWVSIETSRENSKRKENMIGYFAMKINHKEELLTYFVKIYFSPFEINNQNDERKLIED